MFLPGESQLLDVMTRVAAQKDHGIGHVLRVGCYVRLIMEKTGGFTPEACERVEMIARIHDIGNTVILDTILDKQDPLIDWERLEIAQHSVAGCEMLGNVFHEFLPMIRHHHENWDASGYPDHLAGERIPPMARILRMADAFDAMTSWRPYRINPINVDQAIQQLRTKAGIEFDPKLVPVFADQVDKISAIIKWIGNSTPLHHDSRLAIDFNVIAGGAALTDAWHSKSHAFLNFPENPGVVDLLRELSCRYFRGWVFIWPNSSREWNDHKQDQWLRHHHVFDRACIANWSLDYYMCNVVTACRDSAISHFIGYDPETLKKLLGIVPNLYLFRRDSLRIPVDLRIKVANSTQQLTNSIIQPWPMAIPPEA